MAQKTQPTGMRTLALVSVGQLISIIGTLMTGFALTFWAFEETGRATELALVGFFTFAPMMLLGPVAGALVDRWNRKAILIVSDLLAGLSSIAVLLLYVTGNLQVWHLYVTGFFASVFQAFQLPAYLAAMATMVPKEQYARANGIISLSESAPRIIAPALAGLLLDVIGIQGVLLIDVATFVVAVVATLAVHIPQPTVTAEAREKGSGSLLKEVAYGFRYIADRPSLLVLLLVFAAHNLFVGLHAALYRPMILARTDSDQMILAMVQSGFGIGGVVGGLVMVIWGGPKGKKIYAVLGFFLLCAAARWGLGSDGSVVLWALSAFVVALTFHIGRSLRHALWQSKVAPHVQGRVMSTRRMIRLLTYVVTLLAAGPLADQVFEPAMMPGGRLANAFGWLVGTGPGAGMGLLTVLDGAVCGLILLSGFLLPAVRNIEALVPDHDAVSSSVPTEVSGPKRPAEAPAQAQ